MKALSIILAAAGCLLACTVLAAEEQSPADERLVPPAVLHRPQDVAPKEQIIVPRDPMECRPKGGLLAGAQHQPRRVDMDELRKRQLGFFAGRMTTESLPLAGVPVSPPPPPELPDVTSGTNFAEIAYWSFIAACSFIAAWLLARMVMNACRRRRPVESEISPPRAFEKDPVRRRHLGEPYGSPPHVR
jgi:hypothetical protein